MCSKSRRLGGDVPRRSRLCLKVLSNGNGGPRSVSPTLELLEACNFFLCHALPRRWLRCCRLRTVEHLCNLTMWDPKGKPSLAARHVDKRSRKVCTPSPEAVCLSYFNKENKLVA